jgi:hypothetical protein
MLKGDQGGRWRNSEHARHGDTRGFPAPGRRLMMKFSAHKRLMHNIRSACQLTMNRQIEAPLITLPATMTTSHASPDLPAGATREW